MFSYYFNAAYILLSPAQLRLDLSSALFHSALPIKILHAFLNSPMFAKFPISLIFVDLIILADNHGYKLEKVT